MKLLGRGGLVDRAADSGAYDPRSIPLGEKNENKQKTGWGWPILQKIEFKITSFHHN